MDHRTRVLDGAYEPSEIEPSWLDTWHQQGVFDSVARIEAGDPFCIILPPPNVTGALHMGHALNSTIQDVLIRYHRMRGQSVLWQPGIDHAGIATQTVVERNLRKQGKERLEIGRDAFLEEVWRWKEQSGNQIVGQLRRLGASCDWDRLRFTMDVHSSRAVREAFVQLYEQGLIYRGTYLVNWCPSCKTALSDLEVEMEEIDGGLYELHYPVPDGSMTLTVATTRPETMLGDTAVAVHPDDDRYKHLIGTTLVLPIVDREIPVIADDHVDPEYGTGVLKVTPGHDFNDNEIGSRHDLPLISVLDENATIVDGFGELSGLDRFAARKKVLELLGSKGLRGETETLRHAVGHCYRCQTIVEPFLSDQWFVKTEPLAQAVLERVDNKETEFQPDQWEKVFRQWLENIRDWCISRQIWWGHRIPVWTCQSCGHQQAHREDPESCPECRGLYEQDTDVLDTWFSSGLWPMSTLGWPDQTPELDKWYPTSTLVTGFDILFFWVARMMMMGVHFTGKVPFSNVVLHAIVRDEDGEKMSKTKGNVIDPLELIDQYGADALRFTLTAMTTLGRDIRLNTNRIEGYRHFANKLWNAGRFVLRTVGDEEVVPVEPSHPFNRWIWAEIRAASGKASNQLENFAFNDYAQTVYDLAWNRFCDWYIEGSKTLADESEELRRETHATLVYAFRELLRLAHPAMPFLTEELSAALPGSGKSPVALQSFPSGSAFAGDDGLIAEFDILYQSVRSVRNIRAENGLPPGKPLDVALNVAEDSTLVSPEWLPLFTSLAKVDKLLVEPDPTIYGARVSSAEFQIWVPLHGLVDIESELERVEKQLKAAEADLGKVNGKLSNQGFVDKAPAEVVAKERARQSELQDLVDKSMSHLDELRRFV